MPKVVGSTIIQLSLFVSMCSLASLRQVASIMPAPAPPVSKLDPSAGYPVLPAPVPPLVCSHAEEPPPVRRSGVGAPTLVVVDAMLGSR